MFSQGWLSSGNNTCTWPQQGAAPPHPVAWTFLALPAASSSWLASTDRQRPLLPGVKSPLSPHFWDGWKERAGRKARIPSKRNIPSSRPLVPSLSSPSLPTCPGTSWSASFWTARPLHPGFPKSKHGSSRGTTRSSPKFSLFPFLYITITLKGIWKVFKNQSRHQLKLKPLQPCTGVQQLCLSANHDTPVGWPHESLGAQCSHLQRWAIHAYLWRVAPTTQWAHADKALPLVDWQSCPHLQ